MSRVLDKSKSQKERRRHVKLDVKKNDPTVQSVLDKLIPANVNNVYERTTGNTPLNRTVELGDLGRFHTISDNTAGSIIDADNLFQLQPENELAMQILVSSILSPKDFTKVELNFKLAPKTIDSEVGSSLLSIVSDYFENTYKIKKLLPKILENALFKTGSYPLLLLPENSIDEVINGQGTLGLESISDQVDVRTSQVKPIGLLGSPVASKSQGLGLESYLSTDYSPATHSLNIAKDKVDFKLSVYDNPSLLKMPMLKDKMRKRAVMSRLRGTGLGLEAASVDAMNLYKHRRYSGVPVVGLKTRDHLEKKTVGHPLTMHVPPEALITVHVPGNPEDHIGYFMMLENGYPISKAGESDYYKEMSNNMRTNKDMSSSLIRSTHLAQEGAGADYSAYIAEATQTYMGIVEADLNARLANGVYGDGTEIARPQEVYRIMLARSLAGMQTQLLYIPAELMTYFAFDYNQFGVGKSLLEAGKLIASIRSVLLFANTMAAVKNSVQHVGLNINLSPDDPDPAGTVEFLVHEYSKVRKTGYPVGVNKPLDVVNYLQNAGVQVAVQGNAAYPSTQIDVEQKSQNVTRIDNELDDQMRRRQLMSYGLSPETVDMGMNVDFATSIVTNNLLLAKRVMLYQDTLIEMLQDFIRKYVLNSGTMMDELTEMVESNRKKLNKDQKKLPVEELVMLFIEAIEVSLPSPDSATLENQAQAFETYNRALDMALEAYISRDMMDDIALGEMSNDIDGVTAAIKAYFQRQWMHENNMLPELADLTMLNDKNKPVFDLLDNHGGHVDAIAKSLERYLKEMKKRDEARSARMEESDEPTDMGGVDDADSVSDYADDLDVPTDIEEKVEEGTDVVVEEDDEFNFSDEPTIPVEGDVEEKKE